MKATKDTLIGDILTEYPEVQEIMLEHLGEEVPCVMCPGQAFDTFAMIADIHGIESEKIEDMLNEMNHAIKEIDHEKELQNPAP